MTPKITGPIYDASRPAASHPFSPRRDIPGWVRQRNGSVETVAEYRVCGQIVAEVDVSIAAYVEDGEAYIGEIVLDDAPAIDVALYETAPSDVRLAHFEIGALIAACERGFSSEMRAEFVADMMETA